MGHLHILNLVMDVIIIILVVILAKDYWKHKKAGYKLITPEEFKSLYNSLDKNTEILDLRTPQQFSKEKVFKSRNLYIGGMDFKNGIKNFDKRKSYIVFADKTNITKQGAYLLKKEGMSNVYGVKGTWDKIKGSGVTLK